jgi:NAD-dependent deacetylase
VTDGVRTALAGTRARLSTTTRVAALTGAGISAASGVPTFRGAAGSLWNNFAPAQLATPEAFARDPALVWRWYDWRRGLIASAAPNPAHEALARLETWVRSVTVITQNVDGLHARAGSSTVIEYHGSIWRTRCLDCGDEREDRRSPLPQLPPPCLACGGRLRPGVVWFGEAIPAGAAADAEAAARACDLFLVVGTSGEVWPAAGLARLARESDAQVIEFNLERGGVSDEAHLFIAGDAAATLPMLVP